MSEKAIAEIRVIARHGVRLIVWHIVMPMTVGVANCRGVRKMANRIAMHLSKVEASSVWLKKA